MSVEVSDHQYDTIKQLCISLIMSNKTLGTKEASRFPEVPYNTVQHIYRQCFHVLESEQETILKSNISTYINEYNKGVSIESIVQRNKLYLPLFIRFFLQSYYHLDKTEAVTYIQNPGLIRDKALADLVRKCDWGSVTEITNNDRIRQSSGLEYEYLLKEQLRNRNISFRTEAQLRLDGLAKTPDIVLEYPILIKTREYPFFLDKLDLNQRGWKEINWIESKAVFGDQYWLDQNASQLFSYVNRLGSGCVIYWFGFIEGVLNHKDILILSSFPQDVHTLC